MIHSHIVGFLMSRLTQGSYRQVCGKFKDFSSTSQDFPTVFKDWKFMKNTDPHVKILFLKC